VTNTTGISLTAYLVTVHARHHYIQQHQIGELRLTEGDGVRAIGSDENLMIGLQDLMHQANVQRLIVDDQQPRPQVAQRQRGLGSD
jgi:hypothetical protein